MFKRAINKFEFALIKANKPSKDPDLTIRNINDCRKLLGMPKCQSTNIQEKAANYIQQRTSLSTSPFLPEVIYKNWSFNRPLHCEINVLAFSQKMENLQSQYLYKIFEEWGRFVIEEGAKMNPEQANEGFRNVLFDLMQAFNSACYLLNLDANMIQIYLKIYMLSQSHKIEDRGYSHLRYVLDHLLKLEKIDGIDLQFLVVFTSRYPMQSVYHQKERQILNLIYSSLPKFNKEKKYHFKLLSNLIYHLSMQSQISASMKALVLNIYQNYTNSFLRFRAFTTLIDMLIIDKSNISNHLPNLKLFMKEYPIILFKQLSKLFYRADIWIKDFWLPYFDYVSTAENYKRIETYNHFVIDDLLVECKVGGEQLRNAALKFRQFLKSNKIDIQKYDQRKEFEKSFGRIKENKNTCQLHVANSMRLICGAQILTEVPIKYFMVDVLVDQKIIVEINNTHHYKIIDGVTSLNLKSQFRERILTSNGYKCYNMKIDDWSSSNYNMLEDIYKIVEQSGSMKKKNPI